MRHVMLKIEIKLQKCIRMGIISIFKIFIWGGILLDIRWEITFYGSALGSPSNLISDRISDDIPPQMKILNTIIL